MFLLVLLCFLDGERIINYSLFISHYGLVTSRVFRQLSSDEPP